MNLKYRKDLIAVAVLGCFNQQTTEGGVAAAGTQKLQNAGFTPPTSEERDFMEKTLLNDLLVLAPNDKARDLVQEQFKNRQSSGLGEKHGGLGLICQMANDLRRGIEDGLWVWTQAAEKQSDETIHAPAAAQQEEQQTQQNTPA